MDTPARRPFWALFLKKPLHWALDGAVLVLVLALAYLLRFEFDVPDLWVRRAAVQAPFVLATQLAALWLCGVYSFIWRYVGFAEIAAFLRASALAAVPLVVVRFALSGQFESLRMPVSVIVLDSVFMFLGVLGLRVARRTLYERYEKRAATATSGSGKKKPVLLVGAGRAGTLAAREIGSRPDADIDIKGFIDDDDTKSGSVMNGVRVLGTTADLPRLVKELQIDHVVITIARASRSEFRRLLEVCESIPVKARVIPGLMEILQGDVSVSRIRNVEIEDLLGRDPIQLDEPLMQELLTGRTVLVTGAGGSIGSELARQVARLRPAQLLLVERAEGALYDIDRELLGRFQDIEVVPLIADVTDVDRMRVIFERHRPHVVFHAAAHKHVPMMEKNPGEAIKNNVLGTRTVATLAGEHHADAFVLISTDKAVRPTSVMGASKRTAELVIQDLDGRFPGTRFVAVRFGNVLGSAGSVIPLFKEQILKGGPVTVTHPDMVRFFMTIPEASQLVIQAGAMGEGGEIFILDMGEPVKIVDLARDMIRLSGLRPGDDIDIVFSGVRPGEKLYEELQADGEELQKTRHPKIFIGRIAQVAGQPLTQALDALTRAAIAGDGPAVRRALADLVTEATLEGVPADALLQTALPAPAPAGRAASAAE